MSIWFAFFGCLCGAENPAPMPLRPYRVTVWLDFEDHPRLSTSLKRSIEEQFRQNVARLLGEAWDLTATAVPDAFANHGPADPPPVDESIDADKVFWLRIRAADESGRSYPTQLDLQSREFDGRLRQWGPLFRQRVIPGPWVGQNLFALAWSSFRPVGTVSGRKELFTPQALALQPQASPLPMIKPGTAFRLYREFSVRTEPTDPQQEPTETIERVDLPWSYLIYRNPATDRLTANYAIASPLRNPLTARTRQRGQVLAIATGAAGNPQTTVRFVTGPEERPVAGFDVALTTPDRSAIVSIGNTDHRGRISVQPLRLYSDPTAGKETGVVEVLLRTGQVVLARVPIVPGETNEVKVRVAVDPLYTDVHGRVLALQEQVVDNVARRKLLHRRAEAYVEKNDAAKLKQVATEFNSMSNKAYFEQQLDNLKQQTELRSQELKRPKLGRHIERLFSQTANLLEDQLAIDTIEISIPGDTSSNKPR